MAVEIDGSQHLLPERKKKDDEKDELLIDSGWAVIRVSEKEVKENIDLVFNKIKSTLDSNKKQKKHKIGVVLHPKKRKKRKG